MFCRECWKIDFNSKLDHGQVATIKCLDYCCDQKPEQASIIEILEEPTLQNKYRRFYSAYIVDINKNLIKCPVDDCGSVIDKKQQRPLVCSQCKTEVCPKCDMVAHKGSKCRVVRGAGERQFKLWAMFQTVGVKNCPQCNARTEKLPGCNHMSCQRCNA